MSDYSSENHLFLSEPRPARGSLFGAILFGATGALVGAIVWAGVGIATGYEIGWIAIGIGALVGFAVRTGGGSDAPAFGVLAAVLALVGCVAGRLAEAYVLISQHQQASLDDVLSHVTPSEILTHTFSPIDLIFIVIAVMAAYRVGTSATQQ